MGDTRLEPVALSEAERPTLESWAKRRSTAQGLAVRARIVLACANGWNNTLVAARLGVGRDTVRRWRTRFLARRLDGLADEPRPGCRGPSPMPRWKRSWSAPWSRRHRAGRTGRSGSWPRSWGSRRRACCGSGTPSACSRGGLRPSRSHPTRS
ncbi:helix-turn-helix domain-containing protein [Streptomyces sp. NPDC052114]|uniref:helix-turn-helix domain-containing protein n=1 Tax=unclassified Streptomyces TaxID=2593676 RepID=UPI0034134414